MIDPIYILTRRITNGKLELESYVQVNFVLQVWGLQDFKLHGLLFIPELEGIISPW